MRHTKRLLTLLLAAVLLLSLAACTSTPATTPAPTAETTATPTPEATPEATPEPTPEATPAPTPEPTPEPDDVTIRVAALKGPTAIGMIKVINDAPENVEFTLAGAPDEITGSIIKGDFDIACVPTNLAAVLYKKTEGAWKLAALNTLGVLYIVETGEEIQSIQDLEGKTIWSSGKGSTPEYALNYILEQNGVTANVEFASEHAEVAAHLAAGDASVAILPQPFVTSVLAQNENVRVALDVTEEWNKASGGQGGLTMGCVIVRTAFAEEHPQALRDFFSDYAASVEFVNTNVADAAQMVVDAGIIAAAPVAQKAIPQCNIVFITGDEMKTTANGFFEVLFAADPSSVAGSLPDDGIYLYVE